MTEVSTLLCASGAVYNVAMIFSRRSKNVNFYVSLYMYFVLKIRNVSGNMGHDVAHGESSMSLKLLQSPQSSFSDCNVT